MTISADSQYVAQHKTEGSTPHLHSCSCSGRLCLLSLHPPHILLRDLNDHAADIVDAAADAAADTVDAAADAAADTVGAANCTTDTSGAANDTDDTEIER